MSDMIYRGKHVCVRTVQKRNGKIGYALCRPDNLANVLEEFSVLGYAVNIARFIEVHGGNYDADHRRAARHYARGMSETTEAQMEREE